MLLGRFLLCCVRYAHKVQSYRCFSSCCLLTFIGCFHVHMIIKRSAVLRFFIVLRGGGGVMLNLVFGSMFLLRGLCSALCFVCYD